MSKQRTQLQRQPTCRGEERKGKIAGGGDSREQQFVVVFKLEEAS